MATFEEDLAEIYRNYSDEYLIEQLRSGTMTELAIKVAKKELDSRGVVYLEPPLEGSHAVPVYYGAPQFVTVASSLNSIAMHILLARLEAEGIPTRIADAHMAQAYSIVSIAIGGARAQVPIEFYDEAMQIIADINSGALASTDEDVENQLLIDKGKGSEEAA